MLRSRDYTKKVDIVHIQPNLAQFSPFYWSTRPVQKGMSWTWNQHSLITLEASLVIAGASASRLYHVITRIISPRPKAKTNFTSPLQFPPWSPSRRCLKSGYHPFIV